MSNFTWAWDAPSGVYKNHALSTDIRKAAIADTKFLQFAKPEPGYGKKKGENVTIIRISNLTIPTDARLTEGRDIPEDELTISTTSITVVEWGRSVPFSSLADDLSTFDLENVVQKALKDQMSLSLDAACATAFKAGKIKAIPDGISSLTFDTDGTPSTAATVNINFYHVEQIRDYMFTTLHIPPYIGNDYIGLTVTKGKRGLMSDPRWEDWKKYTDPEAKFNSEVGRIENIRFLEINNTNALSQTKGSGGVLGETIIFGADAVSIAMVQDPELRAAIPKDFGRSRSVAWYGILEFGQIWGDSANDGEARVVHVTSS